MNTSNPPPPSSKSFRVLDASLELISELRPLVALVGKHDRSLRDQLRRAAQSIPLNLAEGFGLSGGNSTQRFWSAFGSARETEVNLQVALRWGYVGERDVAKLKELLLVQNWEGAVEKGKKEISQGRGLATQKKNCR